MNGSGYVVRAGDGAVARERAHGAEWRANAGFPLTVGFESLGDRAYLGCVGTRYGQRERRLPA